MEKLVDGSIFYWRQHRDIYKCYTLCVADDNGEKIVLFKYYGKRKQYWHYDVKELIFMTGVYAEGQYSTNRNDLIIARDEIFK